MKHQKGGGEGARASLAGPSISGGRAEVRGQRRETGQMEGGVPVKQPGAGWGARPGRGAQEGGSRESGTEEARARQPAGWELPPLGLRPLP